MASPAEVAGSLLGSGIVGGATGWSLKVGFLPESPDKIICMMDTGGENPNPRWQVDFVTVQAIVRGDVNGYGAAWTKAREVRDKLLGLDSQTMVGSNDRWVSVICRGDVMTLGSDTKNRPLLSVNFRIIIEPAATEPNREPL